MCLRGEKEMDSKLKLFVWEGEGILQDWTSGMVCVLATNLKQAFDLIREKYDDYYLNDLARIEPKIIEEPEAFAVYGGS